MQALRQEGVQRGEGTSQLQTGTWNIGTLKQGGKFEHLKTEVWRNDVSVLGVSGRWKEQGEIRSGDYTVYYSRGEVGSV